MYDCWVLTRVRAPILRTRVVDCVRRRRRLRLTMTSAQTSAQTSSGGSYIDVESQVSRSIQRNPSLIISKESPRARRLLETQFGVAYDKRHSHWSSQGELITQFVFVLFVLATYKLRTANISLCGFMEFAPNWHAAGYYWSATASGNSLIWSTARLIRRESNLVMKLARFGAGAAPVVSLYGTMIFPRCLWDKHQTHVVRWAWTVTAAMGFEYGVDFYQRRIARRTRGERSVNSDLALPQFAWCLGLAITMRYYYTS